ncbi:hypothetical protein [Methyloglobulus sp.]|uniref:hypothetical protein n=1 Tax=Methyloglobulus sp. TaxID=2518622 RepID=UPI00178D8A5F|nr:hypothetical protein [Methyloglobulus sp.]
MAVVKKKALILAKEKRLRKVQHTMRTAFNINLALFMPLKSSILHSSNIRENITLLEVLFYFMHYFCAFLSVTGAYFGAASTL